MPPAECSAALTACCWPAVTFEKEAAVNEEGFGCGVGVYDKTHKSGRGYGVIESAGECKPDGTPTWTVKFERGQRITTISQTYLQLPIQLHDANGWPVDRQQPTAAGQRVLVVVGHHHVGEMGWTETAATTGVSRRPALQRCPCTAPPAAASPPAPRHHGAAHPCRQPSAAPRPTRRALATSLAGSHSLVLHHG